VGSHQACAPLDEASFEDATGHATAARARVHQGARRAKR